jgi:hypothetical protein
VISARWHERASEAAFAIRALTGAASRRGPVSVLVPGQVVEADGAFDLYPLGHNFGWPHGLPAESTILVDELTPQIASLLREAEPGPVHLLSAGAIEPDPAWQRLTLVGERAVGLYIPVNPQAEQHRHHGFGFTRYHLVLSGRTASDDEPPAEVAWLTAAFPEDNVVLVEQGVASAWRARALRGRTSVDTRMDLWRLLAHAAVCIDLAPGPLVARECVEALRLGAPVVVPTGSDPAEVHAASGGGRSYSDAGELVAAVGDLRDTSVWHEVSERGRRYADTYYGDPELTEVSLIRALEDA